MLNVNRLDCMAACFEEGMRMYPAIPTGLPRRVPDCGAMVCGRGCLEMCVQQGSDRGVASNEALT